MPASEAGDFARDAVKLAEAVQAAGEIALRTFRAPIRSWTKDYNSPVSEADMAVDAYLREALAEPGTGWLSEETRDDRKRIGRRRVHIVDPIDGTRAYLAGFPDWSISAALVQDGRPVAAALYAPVSGELFVAAAGAGATRNGTTIAANAGAELAGAILAGPKRYQDTVAARVPQIRIAAKIHSLALRLTRVAHGAVDVAFASANSRDWDLAAADLLVHEAGGALTDAVGETVVYNLHDPVHGMLIAAGRPRHERMLDLVRDHRNSFA